MNPQIIENRFLETSYDDIDLYDENENKLEVPKSAGSILLKMFSTAKKKADQEDSGTGTLGGPEDVEDRGQWSNQAEFSLSCLAYAVGIGNVWRFPYKCYTNGGGAFLIPYFIMLIFAVLPMFYLELALGQFGQLGPNKIFGKIAPLFRGLGYGMLCITGYVSIYYNILIAWSIFYIFTGFTSRLVWEDCTSWFNTPECFSPDIDQACRSSSDALFNSTCVFSSDNCRTQSHWAGNNNSQCYQESGRNDVSLASPHSRASPAEEYFKRYMLMMETDTSLDNMGGMNWKLAGCLLLAWVLVQACLIKGVKSAGKVVWFTALFPYLVLFILLGRGATLPGAAEGINFFLTPDWTKLADVNVWADAAIQIFYSMGPAFGGLVTLSSYSQKNANCQRDAVIVAIANAGTSLLAGFVIFSILGFMAHVHNMDIHEVVDGGISLAFIVYPTAITKLPLAPLWSFLFFTMLLTIGLDSQFTMVESIITAIQDEFPSMRNYKKTVVSLVSLVGFLLGLPICLQGGLYLFVLLDWYSGAWSLILLALLEVFVIGWVYGTDQFFKDLDAMGLYNNRFITAYWTLCWKYTAPILLGCVLVLSLVHYKPAKEGSYVFPEWANFLGWCISLSSVVVVLPFGVYEFYKAKKNNWPMKNLVECDYIWRTQARNMCAKNINRDLIMSPDNQEKACILSPEDERPNGTRCQLYLHSPQPGLEKTQLSSLHVE